MSSHAVSRSRYAALALAFAGLPVLGCGAVSHHAKEPAPDTVQVGYGAQARKDVASAITTVPGDETRSLTSMEQLVEGKVAGVELVHLASGKVSLRIRGQNSLMLSNEPLYVIDGTPVRADNFTDAVAGVNPQAVKRLEILKDAAATAIYGSAGANGVVIITTKRGDE